MAYPVNINKMKYSHLFLFLAACAIISCKQQSSFQNRVIDNIQLQVINEFEYEEGNVIRMWADDSLIYISSDPNHVMDILDHKGTRLRTVGQGGEAPWENGTIWSYDRDSDYYWLHDYPKMALKKYSIQTDSMLLFRRCETKHNVVHLKDDLYLVPQMDAKEGVFYMSLYDAKEDRDLKKVDLCKLTGRFDKLPAYGDYTFQGDFCKNENGSAVFYCMYNSAFFLISGELDTITFHYDVRNIPIAEPIVTEERVVLDPMKCGILSATMDDKYLYFLTPEFNESAWYKVRSFVIDIYEINSCKYVKSIPIPLFQKKYVPFKIAKTNKNFIIEYYGGYFSVYENFMNNQ